jgi:hypothetical protein
MAVVYRPAFAPDNEFQMRLGQAVADLDNPAVFSFLSEINDRDLRLFAPKVFNVYLETWGKMRSLPFRNSYRRYPLVLGVLGELYLNVRERKLAQANPGSEFLDTEAYDSKNLDGTRPDGLVVRRQTDGVLVENIIESKMGGAAYSPAQLYGFARVWQIVGLTMPDGKHYQPGEIRILIEGESVPLLSLPLATEPKATLARLEKSVTLYASESPKHSFGGKVVLTPFSTSQAVKVSKRFMAYAWLGARATADKVTSTLAIQKPLPLGFIPQRKIAEPKIRRRMDRPKRDLTLPAHILYPPPAHSGQGFAERAEHEQGEAPPVPEGTQAAIPPPRPKPAYDDIPGNDNSLVRYIEQNLEFPTSVQVGLSRHMKHVGGRMTVFAEMLDEATRRKLMEKGKAPAIGPMEHWITKTNLAEKEEEVRGALRAYLSLYGKTDPVPFLEKLKKRPEWKEFLEKNSVQSLRETTCHENLEKLSPRDLPGSEGLGSN